MQSFVTPRSPPTHQPSVRFNRLRLGIVLLGVLVILIFAGSSAYDAWRSYRYSINSAEREIGNEANALAEQTAWTLQAVDLLLLDTARWYRSDGQGIAPEGLDAALAVRTAGLQQVRQVMIIDAQGNQRYRSRALSTPNLNISDRSYFTAQRDSADVGLFMSEPLVTRSEHRAAVVLSRRIDDDRGAFAGIITATVDLEDLNQFYRAANVGMAGAIQLLRDDGTLLVRNPPIPKSVGQKFPLLAAAAPAAARVSNPVDGTEDFIAVAPVRATHLRVAVTREVAAALHPWRDETIRVGARTLIIMLFSALIIAALLRQLRRAAASEKALRESEERYALAMEGANEGHWDWDIPTDRLFLSPKMKMLGGQNPDSVIDTRAEWRANTHLHPDDEPRFEERLREHIEGRTARFECEYRVRHADGKWCWLLARGRCLRDPTGRPVRLVGSVMDVTSQKQAQIDKEALEAQLRQSQKLEAIGTLAGGIAHDFNNILGAILGYGELALQESPRESALRRYLDNVMHATERAKMLVERILGFSRSGLGDREPVNVQGVIVETLDMLEASLPPGIRLETHIDAGNAAVMGDATYLHQVAMNLCTNAIHAMEQHGGMLRVRLELAQLQESLTLTRGSLVPGRHVRLTVDDTGPGIEAAVLDRIFDPFFTTKQVGEGTGLGLSVVHGIVTDLGGAIRLESALGKGTTFEIWLPVAGEISAPQVSADPALRRGNGEIIMIVDDERPLVELAEEIAAQVGYEPVGFSSSRAALDAFRAAPHRFDAVITDEAMPELTGIELARQIRGIRTALPVILMTGYGSDELMTEAARIGVGEVLRKPLRRADLADALARVLDIRPSGP
jgi:PAS domain S-box-containing protein